MRSKFRAPQVGAISTRSVGMPIARTCLTLEFQASLPMKRKPANLPRGDSMNPEERVVEQDARKESWLTKILRNTRQAKGRPQPDRKRAER